MASLNGRKRTLDYKGLSVVIAVAFCLATPVKGEENLQLGFETPDAAVRALVERLEADDDAGLGELFGKEFEKLANPDEVQGRAERATVLDALNEMYTLNDLSDGRKELIVGEAAWPFPIPLENDEGLWRFDTAAGVQEILNRRVGRNELGAIESLNAYVDAQIEYAGEDHDGDQVLEYAQRVLSTPGQRDGLYWKVDPNSGEPPSPLDWFVVESEIDIENREAGSPFMGYHFKVLTRQGDHVPGGRYDYVINGNMIAGFAMVAYPVEYGNTGVMTFVVNHQGVIRQKDLGEFADLVAGAMEVYNPDGSWSEVADQ